MRGMLDKYQREMWEELGKLSGEEKTNETRDYNI
jgi:hypothetical protein